MTFDGQSCRLWGKISNKRGVFGMGNGGLELSEMGLRYLAILMVG